MPAATTSSPSTSTASLINQTRERYRRKMSVAAAKEEEQERTTSSENKNEKRNDQTHEIRNLEEDLKARKSERLKLEEKIQMLRQSTMSIIFSDDTSSTLATERPSCSFSFPSDDNSSSSSSSSSSNSSDPIRVLQRSPSESSSSPLTSTLTSTPSQTTTSITTATSNTNTDSHSSSQRSTYAAARKAISERRLALARRRQEKEDIISNYLKRNKPSVVDEGKIRKYQISNLVGIMEEKEAVIIQLRSQLAQLEHHLKREKDLTRLKDSKQQTYKERLATLLYEKEQLKHALHVQEKQIQYGEFQLDNKDHQMEALQELVTEKVRRNIELELDLELQEIKFQSLDSCRRALGGQEFGIVFDHHDPTSQRKEGEEKDMEKSATDPNSESYHLWVRQLRVDLNDMEQRYIQEKRRNAIQISNLEAERENLQTKVTTLEHRINIINDYGNVGGESCKEETGDTSALTSDGDDHENENQELNPNETDNILLATSSGDDSCTLEEQRRQWNRRDAQYQKTIEYARKRLEILEVENTMYRNRIKELKQELVNTRRAADATITSDRNENASLCIENDALRAKIVSLEPPLLLTTDSGSGHQLQTSPDHERYYFLKKKLDEKVSEVLSLEDQLNARDRVIAVLRNQAIDKRLLARFTAATSPTSATTPTTAANSSCNSSFFSDTPPHQQRLLFPSPSPQVVSVKFPSKLRPRSIDDDHVSGTTIDEIAESSSVVSGLNNLLQETEKKLMEREEELRRTRATSQAQLATLQARVERLVARTTRSSSTTDLYFL